MTAAFAPQGLATPQAIELIEISDTGLEQTWPLRQSQLSFGRDASADIVVKGWCVSKLHAVLYELGGQWFLRDQGSLLGTQVNGHRVSDYGPLLSGDQIEIVGRRWLVRAIAPASERERLAEQSQVGPRLGSTNEAAPHVVQVAEAGMAQTLPSGPHALAAVDAAIPPLAANEPVLQAQAMTVTVAESELQSDPQALEDPTRRSSLQSHITQVLRQFRATVDLQRMRWDAVDDAVIRAEAKQQIERLVAKIDADLSDASRRQLVEEIVAEAVGLGVLERLMDDPKISEIMVNRHDEIFVERAGKLQLSPHQFSDEAALRAVLERIVARIGRRIDDSSPMVDARLSDGSRVNAVLSPVALRGTSITIRRFSRRALTAEDYCQGGSASAAMLAFLKHAVEQRRNIVISGGTGSGKTTLLNLLSSWIPANERLVSIEDSAELRLAHANRVALEARPSNAEGQGAIAIRDLVRNALRMRPDRIIVGECRGAEALDMLQAMNTGHEGSMTTVHANSARDVFSRMEVMVMLAGFDIPIQAIREQVASAVDLIVHQARGADGRRRIVAICEVAGMEGGTVQSQMLFEWRRRSDGSGHFAATGLVPRFNEQLNEQGLGCDLNWFGSEVSL